ncbi:MAG: hypothetical protein L0Y57_03285 [Beijerinckiaceae bacterium]|nr:hypothetical protein [Beijerinckiaceae bacterium]
MVVFDTTILSLLLRPGCRPPSDPATGEPVAFPRERLEALIEALQESRTIAIVPAPVLSELLIKAGNAGPGIVAAIQRSAAFRVAPFDTRAAIELAHMTNTSLTTVRERREAAVATTAKIKFDRQIVAIAKVQGVTAIYSDDKERIAFAQAHGITCVRVADLPVPESARQPQLPLTSPPPDET